MLLAQTRHREALDTEDQCKVIVITSLDQRQSFRSHRYNLIYSSQNCCLASSHGLSLLLSTLVLL